MSIAEVADMQNKLISVIVPIYKTEQFLRRCIDSILNQTYSNLECILVDDGSPDGCPEICDEYACLDSRIKVIHKENGGLSSARNAGLDIAKGEYIGFVDSDDYIHPQMYEILQECLDITDSGMSCCEEFKCEVNQNIEEQQYDLHEVMKNCDIYSAEDIILSYPSMYSKLFVIVVTKLYRRSIFRNLRFDEGKIYEDNMIYFPAVYNAKQCVVIHQPLYYYVMSEGSITRSGFSAKNLCDIDVQIKFMNFFMQHGYIEKMRLCEKSYLDKVLYYSYLSMKKENDFIKKEMEGYQKELFVRKKHLLSNPQIDVSLKLSLLMFDIAPRLSKLFYIWYDRYRRRN